MEFLILIPVVALSLVVHELGHLLVWRRFGIRAHRIVFSWRGVGISYAADRQDLSAAQQLAGAAGGPVASALLAVALWKVSPLFALSSLELAVLNLLPVKGADGRTMFRVLPRVLSGTASGIAQHARRASR